MHPLQQVYADDLPWDALRPHRRTVRYPASASIARPTGFPRTRYATKPAITAKGSKAVSMISVTGNSVAFKPAFASMSLTLFVVAYTY